MWTSTNFLDLGEKLHAASLRGFKRDRMCAETVLVWDADGNHRLTALGAREGLDMDVVRGRMRSNVLVLDREVLRSKEQLAEVLAGGDRTQAAATICYTRQTWLGGGPGVLTSLVSPGWAISRHLNSPVNVTPRYGMPPGQPGGDEGIALWLTELLPWEQFASPVS